MTVFVQQGISLNYITNGYQILFVTSSNGCDDMTKPKKALSQPLIVSLRVNYFSTIALWAIKIKFFIARMEF